jgi:hypothetical protein
MVGFRDLSSISVMTAAFSVEGTPTPLEKAAASEGGDEVSHDQIGKTFCLG